MKLKTFKTSVMAITSSLIRQDLFGVSLSIHRPTSIGGRVHHLPLPGSQTESYDSCILDSGWWYYSIRTKSSPWFHQSSKFSQLLCTGYSIWVCFSALTSEADFCLSCIVQKKRFSYSFDSKGTLRPGDLFIDPLWHPWLTMLHVIDWDRYSREFFQRVSNAYYNFIRKLEWKFGILLVRTVNSLDDNINLKLKQTGQEGWDYILSWIRTGSIDRRLWKH